MNPGTLVQLTDASTTLTQVGAYSVPMFLFTITIAAVLAGVIIGGTLTARFVGSVKAGVMKAVGARRGGGRRRRR